MQSFRRATSAIPKHLMPQRRSTLHYGQRSRLCTTLCSERKTCKDRKSSLFEEGAGTSRSYHESGTNKAVHAPSPRNLAPLDDTTNSKVAVQIDDQNHEFSALLLRDLCQCPACVHESTNQKLYSTADIPPTIKARSINSSESISSAIEILWHNDVPGFKDEHVTTLGTATLRAIVKKGATPNPFSRSPSTPISWDARSSQMPDFDYQAYMQDDAILLDAIEQLQTHGLVFVTNVPPLEKSVSTIAERIGPIKDTFYGQTWDVRTVPKAINAAYTSNDLGFHTDLLYFDNPPHIQLLHCIQSSSSGGASVFADAFKCALDLYESDIDTFNILATYPVNYHYRHPDLNLYSATKPVFDLRPLRIGDTTFRHLSDFLEAWTRHRDSIKQSTGMTVPHLTAIDCLDKINWGPPFMAPFSILPDSDALTSTPSTSPSASLSTMLTTWHTAARKFAALLDRPEILHERLMKPGECVLFNNTRVLHSRRAFESGDVGKERWLRGTYVDRDPFFSKLRVLENRYGKGGERDTDQRGLLS